jgi:hypothetical protein
VSLAISTLRVLGGTFRRRMVRARLIFCPCFSCLTNQTRHKCCVLPAETTFNNLKAQQNAQAINNPINNHTIHNCKQPDNPKENLLL